MRIGTQSVLFGVHCPLVHTWLLALGWYRLYGFPWDPRLWVAFAVHDLGYAGLRDVESAEAEDHVQLGARIMGWLFGVEWADFTVRHSRQWARKHGIPVSRLCYADKMAFVLTPGWLYLPLARASGELYEYMAMCQERQAGPPGFTEDEQRKIASGDAALWLEGLQSYTRRWICEHMGGAIEAESLRGNVHCELSRSKAEQAFGNIATAGSRPALVGAGEAEIRAGRG